jgi:helicase MOV-10
LACAPSNSAADIIAQRLIPLGNKRLFRLYAPSRLKILVDEELLPFTYTHKDGPFSVPDLAQLMAFRVVVTTCVSAYIPFGVGVPKGHFTHIFIDEAGQATEPEAMVSIRTTVDKMANVILSGDPKQLGPVIRSGVARELGLGKSYLERLMENTILYDETSTDATSKYVLFI